MYLHHTDLPSVPDRRGREPQPYGATHDRDHLGRHPQVLRPPPDPKSGHGYPTRKIVWMITRPLAEGRALGCESCARSWVQFVSPPARATSSGTSRSPGTAFKAAATRCRRCPPPRSRPGRRLPRSQRCGRDRRRALSHDLRGSLRASRGAPPCGRRATPARTSRWRDRRDRAGRLGDEIPEYGSLDRELGLI